MSKRSRSKNKIQKNPNDRFAHYTDGVWYQGHKTQYKIQILNTRTKLSQIMWRVDEGGVEKLSNMPMSWNAALQQVDLLTNGKLVV